MSTFRQMGVCGLEYDTKVFLVTTERYQEFGETNVSSLDICLEDNGSLRETGFALARGTSVRFLGAILMLSGEKRVDT